MPRRNRVRFVSSSIICDYAPCGCVYWIDLTYLREIESVCTAGIVARHVQCPSPKPPIRPTAGASCSSCARLAVEAVPRTDANLRCRAGHQQRRLGPAALALGAGAGRVPAPPSPTRVLRSDELLAGATEVLILHGGDAYRLRLTRKDKLILTK
jgi:hemin uptake protein HemP